MKNEIFAFCAGFIFCLFVKFAFKLRRKVLSDNGNRIELIQEDLMTAQKELQELQTQLSMQAELLKKSEKEARKK